MVEQQSTNVESILSEANFFLHRLSVETASLQFIKTSRSKLSSVPFIDGREDFSTEQVIYNVSLEQALQWHKSNQQKVKAKFIFHNAFCGSTLLANTLTNNQNSFVYKEPQVLIDLAQLKFNQHLWFTDKNKWQALLSLVINQLNKTWTTDEYSVIKPSNWVNSIIDDLVSIESGVSATFLSSSAQEFLLATLRGGRERISYIYQVKEHFKAQLPEFEPILAQIERREGAMSQSSDIERIVCNILVVYEMQKRLFTQGIEKLKESDKLSLSYHELMASPSKALSAVNQVFSLNFTASQLQAQIEQSYACHSKNSQINYDNSLRQSIDEQVSNSYQTEIEFGLFWYANHLLEQSNNKQLIA